MKHATVAAAPPGPLMTVDEACIYLRFVHADGTPNRQQFYDWKRRARPAPRCYRLSNTARGLRLRREDIDAVLVAEGGPPVIDPRFLKVHA